MHSFIERLVAEHRTMARLLSVAERQAALLGAAEEIDRDLLHDLMSYFADFPELVHHPKEDLMWAAAKARDPEAAAACGDLEAEHDRLGQLAQGFAAAIDAVLHDLEIDRTKLQQAITRFVEAERSHLAAEESRYFPAAQRILTDDDWAAVERQANARPEPIGGGEERFQRLKRAIEDAERDAR